MKRNLLLAFSACALLSSCQTTGDPTQGGLFGWSQSKADQRLEARANYLDDVERDTDNQRRRSRELEAEKARKQRELNRVQ
jgi:hypothetical protein